MRLISTAAGKVSSEPQCQGAKAVCGRLYDRGCVQQDISFINSPPTALRPSEALYGCWKETKSVA